MWILGLKGFNIRKIAKFKSDVYWSEQRYGSAKLWKFTDICMVGGKFVPPPPPMQTSVKFRDFEELNLL